MQSMMTLLEGYFSLKSAGMCSSTLLLEGQIGMVLNLKYMKLIHEIVIRLTVASEIPYKCPR